MEGIFLYQPALWLLGNDLNSHPARLPAEIRGSAGQAAWRTPAAGSGGGSNLFAGDVHPRAFHDVVGILAAAAFWFRLCASGVVGFHPGSVLAR